MKKIRKLFIAAFVISATGLSFSGVSEPSFDPPTTGYHCSFSHGSPTGNWGYVLQNNPLSCTNHPNWESIAYQHERDSDAPNLATTHSAEDCIVIAPDE